MGGSIVPRTRSAALAVAGPAVHATVPTCSPSRYTVGLVMWVEIAIGVSDQVRKARREPYGYVDPVGVVARRRDEHRREGVEHDEHRDDLADARDRPRGFVAGCEVHPAGAEVVGRAGHGDGGSPIRGQCERGGLGRRGREAAGVRDGRGQRRVERPHDVADDGCRDHEHHGGDDDEGALEALVRPGRVSPARRRTARTGSAAGRRRSRLTGS